jgi:hypothetical protein
MRGTLGSSRSPAEALKLLGVSDTKSIMLSIPRLSRSIEKRLEMAGGMNLVALAAANIFGLLLSTTGVHPGLDPWLALTAAVSTVLCVAAILMKRGVSRRLRGLTESVQTLARSFDETAVSFASE